MIQLLNHQEEVTAKQILVVQLLAYNVEAKLIGFNGIPRLKDSIQDIIHSDETFIGWYMESQLIGFISYIKSTELIDICRLVVHPDHFRKGIASALLNYVIDTKAENQRMEVSTGGKNIPAIQLYESLGFTKTKDMEIEPNFFITCLSYK